jgi:serine protease AprX
MGAIMMNRIWNRVRAGVAVGAVLFLTAAMSGPIVAQARAEISVVVQGGTTDEAASAVQSVGGTVRARLDLVAGVAADLAPAGVEALRAQGLAVAPDSRSTLADTGFAPGSGDVQLAALDPGPGWNADAGAGVGVALVDTGVADVADLTDRLVRGPDLSGEGDGLDHHGHGTFMAGLIAGDGSAGAGDEPRHNGVAPGAHVVAVKVAGRDGTTSLSRILAGIKWVVDHAEENNIRVLNLSFGFDSPVPWAADPLSMAVERAWASGITVVAAAGNEGAGKVPSPGRDPWVITAGATDTHGTATTADDTVPSWSGWERRGPASKPDVVAPGVSVISLRAPGSLVDDQNPAARVGDDYFRGSGTSMATAITSGAAAVIIADHPDAVSDDVKGALVSTSNPIAGSPAGAVDLSAAGWAASDPGWWQQHPLAGEAGGRPQRIPWAEDGKWNTNRWYTNRWYTNRWYTNRWYTNRWYTNRWYTNRWYTNRWYSEPWSTNRWYTSQWDGGWSTLGFTADDPAEPGS